jgi:hypothetical protein
MASLQKSQNSNATAATSSTPESNKISNVRNKKKHAELLKHLEKLLCYREALYDPVSKKKLFIINAGICLNRSCQWDKNHHMVKVAMPESCRTQFRQPIPFEFIGKRVICFQHFPFNLQIQYLKTGSFPMDAKFNQKTKNTTLWTGPEHAPGALDNDNSWVRSILTITVTAQISNSRIKIDTNQ